VLGVVVLVVAVIALQAPSQHSVHAGGRVHRTKPMTPSRPVHASPSTHSHHSAHPHRSSTTSGHPGGTSASSPGHSHGHTHGHSARAPLVVLNNTTISGLAQDAADRFESGGWKVSEYSNYQNDILSTCAYYDPSVDGSQAAARALAHQFPGIKRVKPQFAQLASWHSPVVVILTPDWSSS
jgi:hypothetical protein